MERAVGAWAANEAAGGEGTHWVTSIGWGHAAPETGHADA
eukprot:CAMPEP_0196667410 /NCGR_PEP_ID=MMETSP1086-20130531/65050_1 /TAXON_ID=77921 /ORGANISM="Cyanoptyche  gloeocystis , Strain SAG4.97" /LENGTH=39 /DNA_ID= /DNA_START= /DNA_END= /DNA_ORIENTATION=